MRLLRKSDEPAGYQPRFVPWCAGLFLVTLPFYWSRDCLGGNPRTGTDVLLRENTQGFAVLVGAIAVLAIASPWLLPRLRLGLRVVVALVVGLAFASWPS